MAKTLAPKNSVVRHGRKLMLLAVIGLMAVPAAAASASSGAHSATATTTNAAAAGAASAALADLGCDRGAIHAFARVKGELADFPNIYTTSTTFVDISYNCTGGAISARRASTGVYFIRFAGDGSKLAIAQNNADGFGLESTNNDNILTVARVTDTDGGISFRVEVQDVCGDCSQGADPQNGRFVLMVI
ncbi:MAG TPA: hypothetical protein VF062_08745 [Candidatus Limnocylindrales bacterium]